MTHEAAEISALMESIECYHAEYIDIPLVYGTPSDLSEVSVNVANLSRLKGDALAYEKSIGWYAGVDLLSDQLKIVPSECVHMDCRVSSIVDNAYFISDTNGLASARSLTAALNHGICEVIERDAMALWSLTPPVEKPAKKILLSSITNQFAKEFFENCKSINLGVGIWDITSDMGVPTFICKIASIEYQANSARPSYGTAAHVSKEIALIKAITEAAQSRITFISGARDDQYETVYEDQLSKKVHDRWHSDIVLQPEVVSFDQIKGLESDDSDEVLSLLLNSLRSQGISEVVYVDLTKKSVGLPVIKVVIPGMEGVTFSGKRLVGNRGKDFFMRRGTQAQ